MLARVWGARVSALSLVALPKRRGQPTDCQDPEASEMPSTVVQGAVRHQGGRVWISRTLLFCGVISTQRTDGLSVTCDGPHAQYRSFLCTPPNTGGTRGPGMMTPSGPRLTGVQPGGRPRLFSHGPGWPNLSHIEDVTHSWQIDSSFAVVTSCPALKIP